MTVPELSERLNYGVAIGFADCEESCALVAPWSRLGDSQGFESFCLSLAARFKRFRVQVIGPAIIRGQYAKIFLVGNTLLQLLAGRCASTIG